MNNSRLIRFTAFLLLFAPVLLTAQQGKGYRITVKANTYQDSVCYLGYYYGKFKYAKDTAVFNNKGIAVFEKADKQLDKGVYFLLLPGKKLADIIVNKEQQFTVQLDTANILKSLTITGSKENQWFCEYNKKMEDLNTKMTKLQERENKFKDQHSDSAEIVKEEISELNDRMVKEKEDFIAKHPDTFISKVFLIAKDPEFPNPPKKEDGKVDSLQLFYMYRNDYWKNSDFTEEAIVRTPVFHNRLERYFTNVILQDPDTIIKEIDKIVEKTNQKGELFKYIIWYLTYQYETSQIMGHDAVFVDLVDKYYKTGKAFWVSEAQNKKIIERANKISPILIGKIAPNIALVDTTLHGYISMHSIISPFTIMIFWDPSCGHCKKEIEKLKEVYEEKYMEYGIKVYSVCTDSSLTKWKKSIHEKGIEYWINVNATRSALGHYQELFDVMSTPMIYVLDEKKKIIAKKLSAEASVSFIGSYINRKKDENEFKIHKTQD